LPGKKTSPERADKAFAAAYESEKKGNYVNAVKSYVEAGELYSDLNNKLMEAEANYFAGHCRLLQTNRAESTEDFKQLLKNARDFLESSRKIYIKLVAEDIKPDIRSAIIDSSLVLSDFANSLEEPDLTKRMSKLKGIVEGLEKCSATYQKFENFEKSGIVEYWSGIAKLRNYLYVDNEKREETLNSVIINFSNSKKFLQIANKERPALCFSSLINKAKIASTLESHESDENKKMSLVTIREDVTKSQDEEKPFCGGFAIYNQSWIDFNQATFVKNTNERFILLQSAKELAEQAVSSLLKDGEQNLTAEAYFVSAMASKELSETTRNSGEYESFLKIAYDNFRECLKYARIFDETWLIAEVLAEIPGIIADYSTFIQSEVLKRDILREGASIGREALEYVKKLPNDFTFLGTLYLSMSKYVSMTSTINENKELTSEELERVRDLRSRAFRYGERAVEYFEKAGKRNPALEIASRTAFLLSKVVATDQEKIEILERAASFAETAIERYKSQKENLKAAHVLLSLGFVYEDLWNLSNKDEHYRKAKVSYADAAKFYTNANWVKLPLSVLCKMADLDDRKGNYKMSSDYYLEASKKYEQVVSEMPELKDNVKFTKAMYYIELARDKEKKDWATAKEYYDKALSIFPKAYEGEAKFFAVRAKLLEAEAISMGKEGEKAAEIFDSAAQTFRDTISYLNTGKIFSDFTEAKAEIERGLISDKEGKREAAIVHFTAAKEKLDTIPTKASIIPEDVSAQKVLVNALLELEKAQIDNKLEIYQAAGQLFQECAGLFTNERMKNVSKGYSDLCYGIENLVRCRETEKDPMQEYINATTYFERAQKFFQEAGLKNYVDYLEGMKNYLDGVRYSRKLESELVNETKMSYYSMIEKSFKNAIDIFQKSGYTYLKEEVASEFEKAKRSQTLHEYISLVGSAKTPEGGEGYVVLMPNEALENAFVILRVMNSLAHIVFQPEEDVTINFEITNIGAKTATLDRIEDVVPPDFKIRSEEISKTLLLNIDEFMGNIKTSTQPESQISDSKSQPKYSLSLNGKKLQKGQTEKLTIKIKPSKPGAVNYQPTLIYFDENNNKKFFKLNIPILVSK
jgi:hypothetical protein